MDRMGYESYLGASTRLANKFCEIRRHARHSQCLHELCLFTPWALSYTTRACLEPGNLSTLETSFCARIRWGQLQGFGIFVHVGFKKVARSLGSDKGATNAFFLFFTPVTGPGRSLSLELSDTRFYASHIRARLGTDAPLCRVRAINTNCLAKTAYRSAISCLFLAFPTSLLCCIR
jgi:hypothetical protein